MRACLLASGKSGKILLVDIDDIDFDEVNFNDVCDLGDLDDEVMTTMMIIILIIKISKSDRK